MPPSANVNGRPSGRPSSNSLGAEAARAAWRSTFKVPPVSEWWRSPEAAPARIDMVAKACSIVLWGWGDGAAVPAEALAVLARDVGPPAALQQAKEVYGLFEVKRELEAARRLRDQMRAKAAHAVEHDFQVARVLQLKERGDAAQRRVNELSEHVGNLQRLHVAAQQRGMSRWKRVASKLTGAHGRLLPICFITYRSSQDARLALSLETVTALKAVGVQIGPAPRPTDIEWTHLHQTTNARKLAFYDLFCIVVMVPAIGMAILVATGFAQMCLFWVPMNCLFTGWCPAAKALGGLQWLWGIFMFVLVYELLHQLQALPLGDGGLWPKNFAPQLKDWYHSRTLGQFRFVKVVGSIEVLVVFFCLLVCVTQVSSTLTSTLHKFDLDPLKDPTSDTQITFAKELCDFTCVCWWINPNLPSEREGSWYDFGAGFGVNAIVNCLIGDALLNSFGARHLVGLATRSFFAQNEPTQHLMDQAVRSRDPYYLPWRIVHLIKVWFFAVVLWPLVPLVGLPAIAYYFLSFLIDRANMLTLLEPSPPSSGLLMRYVLSVMMPGAIPIHLVVAIIGYVDKSMSSHREQPFAYASSSPPPPPPPPPSFPSPSSLVDDSLGDLASGAELPPFSPLPPPAPPLPAASPGGGAEGGGGGSGATVGEAMADPRVIFYILFGLLLLVCMAVDMLVYQARIARSRGTLTPWQVLLMSLRTDGNGFEVSSRAEPFPDVDASLEGLSDEAIQQLYRPPLTSAEQRESAVTHGFLFSHSDWTAQQLQLQQQEQQQQQRQQRQEEQPYQQGGDAPPPPQQKRHSKRGVSGHNRARISFEGDRSNSSNRARNISNISEGPERDGWSSRREEEPSEAWSGIEMEEEQQWRSSRRRSTLAPAAADSAAPGPAPAPAAPPDLQALGRSSSWAKLLHSSGSEKV